MGSSSAEILSLVLGILSIVSFLLCSTTDCWRQDAKDPYSSVGLSSRCRGLWSECVYDNMANIWTCDIPVSYLSAHPVALVVTRALFIAKGVLCIAAAPLLILGMKCSTIINSKDQHKLIFSKTSGVMLLMGGVAGGTAVFWYAIDTAFKYRTEVGFAVPGITYELGYSYWFAAASSVCSCSSAVLLISLNCRGKSGADKKMTSTALRSHNNAMTYL
ncbi:claudin-16-like [Rhinophrynus dorsalis]